MGARRRHPQENPGRQSGPALRVLSGSERQRDVASRKLIWPALLLAGLAAAAIHFRPDRAIRVATGFVAHTLCSKTFVSGLDPQTVFSETVDRQGIRRLRWGLNYRLDRASGIVDASFAGMF